MIQLHEDEIPSGALRIYQYHPYVVSAHGAYVHRPRSAYISDQGVSIQFWCGQYGHVPRVRPTQTAEAAVCGTCEGRYLGQSDDDPDLIFRPRSPFVIGRVWCPGRNQNLWTAPQTNWRLGHCLLCGFDGRVNVCGGRGYGHSSQKLEPHRPLVERALIACPEHGWKRLDGYSGTVTCSHHRCEFTATAPPGMVIG